MPIPEIIEVESSEITPFNSEQSLVCPNCHRTVPIGLTKAQLDDVPPGRELPFDCPNCDQPLIIKCV